MTPDMKLFGGLATAQIMPGIERGCSRTSESALGLITQWRVKEIPAEFESKKGFLWRSYRSSSEWYHAPVHCSVAEYTDSFLTCMNVVKTLTFYVVATWGSSGKLTQEKICRALSKEPLSASVISSISANLNSGVIHGLYEKNGTGKLATYRLASEFQRSSQMKYFSSAPSLRAMESVKKRVRLGLVSEA